MEAWEVRGASQSPDISISLRVAAESVSLADELSDTTKAVSPDPCLTIVVPVHVHTTR
jgi:hypothetical protein